MRRSTYSNSTFVTSLAPAAARTTSANGTSVDRMQTLQAYRSAMLVVHAGTVTDGTHAVKVQESADGSTGWTDVAAGNLQGSLPSLSSSADEAVTMVGVRPTKRYLRAVSTVSGATTGGVYAVSVVLGRPRFKPVSHS